MKPKTVILITFKHDHEPLCFSTLTGYLNSINASEQQKRALQRRKMPFEYYGMEFKRLKVQ